MNHHSTLAQWLSLHKNQFHNVVPFNETTDKILMLDFTAANSDLSAEILGDTEKFSSYIFQKLDEKDARYGYGGYAEHRTVYSRSAHFNGLDGGEPRRLHLGMDIWGPAGTPVFAPLGGLVHSFAFNNHHGDYGATIILSHQLDGRSFYTLYGHLSLQDLDVVREGNYIVSGEAFAHFGPPSENGHWPPHLHFQVIEDIGLHSGDYPGVCRFSEKEAFLANCPNPDLVLQMQQWAA